MKYGRALGGLRKASPGFINRVYRMWVEYMGTCQHIADRTERLRYFLSRVIPLQSELRVIELWHPNIFEGAAVSI